jgi:orotidine-5'-phosphate decarboxylase
MNDEDIARAEALRSEARSRLIAAIDTSDLVAAQGIAAKLAGHVGALKLGLELHAAAGGPQVVHLIGGMEAQVFFDGKFCDIPNTVASAVAAILGFKRHELLGILNVHCWGGMEMLIKSREALDSAWGKAGGEASGHPKPLLLGVTILTTQKYSDFVLMGIAQDVSQEPDRAQLEFDWLQGLVLNLSGMAHEAGLDGVIVPGPFAKAVRELFPSLKILVAGIRFPDGERHDQIHIATPGGAIRNGADFVVMGRALTEAEDPAAEADRAVEQIAEALAERGEGA